MRIEARNVPVEVILCLRASDPRGVSIDRLVYLDTDTNTAKQYLLQGDHSVLKDVVVGSFHFLAESEEDVDMLKRVLPEELHSKIVRK